MRRFQLKMPRFQLKMSQIQLTMPRFQLTMRRFQLTMTRFPLTMGRFQCEMPRFQLKMRYCQSEMGRFQLTMRRFQSEMPRFQLTMRRFQSEMRRCRWPKGRFRVKNAVSGMIEPRRTLRARRKSQIVVLTRSHEDHEVCNTGIRSSLCGFVPLCELILAPAEGQAVLSVVEEQEEEFGHRGHRGHRENGLIRFQRTCGVRTSKHESKPRRRRGGSGERSQPRPPTTPPSQLPSVRHQAGRLAWAERFKNRPPADASGEPSWMTTLPPTSPLPPRAGLFIVHATNNVAKRPL